MKLDERADAARVDEAHLTEIDDNGGSALARRVPQRGAKVAHAGGVELAFGSDYSWFSSGQCTRGRCWDGTVISAFDAQRPR